MNGAAWDNTEDEFVELRNLGAGPVPLYDPIAPTNTWQLRDALRYLFPTNQALTAGERVLVVSFDPAAEPAAAEAFRARHGLGPETRLFGPYEGKLDNAGESVELIQPDMVRFYATNEVVTEVMVDRVKYHERMALAGRGGWSWLFIATLAGDRLRQ